MTEIAERTNIVAVAYHEVCEEIGILEYRINRLEQEYNFLYKCLHNGNKKPIMRANLILDRMNEICEKVEQYSTVLEWKYEEKEEMEKKMSKLDTVDNKVVYMRDVKGMSLAEIAQELGYSEVWIKKISARNSKLKSRKSILSVY